jgi:hypothetical protein
MAKQHRSYKHPILESIFKEKRDERIPPEKQEIITFTYDDIRTTINKLDVGRNKQASLSNFVIDLTRVDRGIECRVPPYIEERGYDLVNVKKYGNERIAGAFKFVGIGNEVKSWLEWPATMHTIEVDSGSIPTIVLDFIRQDEGALFSIIDYCDIMSKVLSFHLSEEIAILRVQHPLKWQPHEIDGLYISEDPRTLYPVEAKALSTHDQVNLYQMRGELETMKMNYKRIPICPLGCQMLNDGMRFAIFPRIASQEEVPLELIAEEFVKVTLKPEIQAWAAARAGGRKSVNERADKKLIDFK